jgi:arylsulfatase A-like enzyme
MVSANNIGSRPQPDLLTVSFSSNDAVGHEYGPDSAEIADEQLRLDSTIGKLMQFINARVGPRLVLWALTADHGAEPTPEDERELRNNSAARRVSMKAVENELQQQLDDIFHQPDAFKWFAAVMDSGLYFDVHNLQQHHISLRKASEAVAKRVKVDGITAFYDMSELHKVHGTWGTLLKNSNYPSRSGDVYYIPDEWVLISEKPRGTSHSNPYHYDTHVPLAIIGADITPQRIDASVHVTDLTPTLAALLGMRWHSDEKESKSRAGLIQRNQRLVGCRTGETVEAVCSSSR